MSHKRPFDIWTTYAGHGGIDYPYAAWTPAPATGNGYISARGYNDRGGNFAYVIYDDGQVEGYFHLASHDGPGEGARVSEGTTVGYVGSTGNSTGPHLHHEVENPQGNLREPDDYWNYVDRSDHGYVGGSGGAVGHPAFPLPWGYYFGWADGPAESVSGYYSHGHDLAVWQQRMLDRGWGITVDGLYGPNTNQVATDFQAQKGLVVDGKIGPATWDAAWTAPIT
jgi:murein DD-endopeptidase MepM/ murein hydrolase activator NlpD